MNNIATIFKDGDDGGNIVTASNINIEILETGYIVKIELGEDEIKTVHVNKSELLDNIGQFL
jgi:hypothetical protein